MKPKLAPRQITAIVCYAALVAAGILILLLAGWHVCQLSLSLQGSSDIPFGVVMTLGMYVIIFIGAVLLALLYVVPLILSVTNAVKCSRKRALTCLVFDAIALAVLLAIAILYAPNSASFTLPFVLAFWLVFSAMLALGITALTVNVKNIRAPAQCQPCTAQSSMEVSN